LRAGAITHVSAVPSHFGRYEIQRQLGKGGMGALYLASDPVLNRLVAVKLLRFDIDDDEMRSRFNREAQAIARLRHPNIVAIYDVGDHENLPFIVMEYVPGDTVNELIARAKPITTAVKLRLIAGVCRGLGHAHGQGIVHRDVKPANVIVDQDGTPKLVDFGIAVVEGGGSTTRPGVLLGSVNYMSPEQVAGRKVDARTDIYSVGALLYEFLTYQKAFPGTIDRGILNNILTQPPATLTTFVPDIPRDLEALVMRTLEKDPDRRYQDANELAQDLARMASSVGAHESSAAAPVDAPSPSVTVMMPAPSAGAERAKEEVRDSTVYLDPLEPELAGTTLPDVELVVASATNLPWRGRTIRITKPEFVIGRDQACDLCLDDETLSRRHALIEYRDRRFTIDDAGSANGLWVNGRRVAAREPLLFGATITIGRLTLLFRYARDTRLPDLSGTEVAARYRLNRLLRESTTGAMYAALDKKLQTEVAVKLLSPELARYPGYREQLKREAEIAAALRHPHICKVIDYGDASLPGPSGQPVQTQFLCLELMTGGSLRALLEARTAVPLPRAIRWTEQLADALRAAHKNGVVHGDLKPSAVVFDEHDNVYLTDFALAQRAIVSEGRPAIGTPAYMAPELWDQAALTPASDQFALAALTYHVITGSPAFEGQEIPEIRRRNFRSGPRAAHEEAEENGREAVPKSVSAVLSRGMAVTPDARYPSAQDFAAALAEAVHAPAGGSDVPQVFISYQREVSTAWAVNFARELKARGFQCYIDVQGRDRAGQFPARITREIERCDVFVCLLAGTTFQSEWVRREIAIAHQHRKPMVPVFQESHRASERPPEGTDAAVDALLNYDGVFLFDQRGVFIDATLAELEALIRNNHRRAR
jgi:serine/threonine protein kinase